MLRNADLYMHFHLLLGSFWVANGFIYFVLVLVVKKTTVQKVTKKVVPKAPEEVAPPKGTIIVEVLIQIL